MKAKLICLIITIFTYINVHAQIDHTFTYQGELLDNGSPAQGVYDISILAFDNVNATGSEISSSTHSSVQVSAGLFTIKQVDLGSSIFDGMDVWLQILVKKPTDVIYITLTPLQKVQSVPYANTLIDNGAIDGQVLTFDNVNGWQPSTPVNETDDQNIVGSGLSGTILTIGIESGSNQAIDLVSLQDGGATTLDQLTDAKSDSDGTDNGSSVFIGVGAGVLDNSNNNNNVGVGYQSLYSNTSGANNIANGAYSLYSNESGSHNTANGVESLYSNTVGIRNTANGIYSLRANTIGQANTASGSYSLYSNTLGHSNTAIGFNAFFGGTQYINSTALGANAEPGASNTVRLGNANVSTIGGYANWTNVSDARFKTNIKEDVPGLAFIKKLRPVTYQLDMDAIARFNKTTNALRLPQSEALKAAEIQTGFLAQEVEVAALSLGYDFHGVDKPKNNTSHYGLRYAEFVVPLVKAVQELADTNKMSYAQVQNNQVTSLQQKKQINFLKVENQQLKDRLDIIEQLLLEITK